LSYAEKKHTVKLSSEQTDLDCQRGSVGWAGLESGVVFLSCSKFLGLINSFIFFIILRTTAAGGKKMQEIA